jgi:hypothetical protein
MDIEHQRRIANNESLFRSHNEAIREAVVSFQALADESATHGFMCECPITECEETLELTMTQYEEGRSDPAWFLVKPEHMLAGGEHMVHDRGEYWIVAKDGVGREVAEAQAPRTP